MRCLTFSKPPSGSSCWSCTCSPWGWNCFCWSAVMPPPTSPNRTHLPTPARWSEEGRRMAHTPVDHVVDETGHWTIFTDLFGGVHIPLLDLRPHFPFTF